MSSLTSGFDHVGLTVPGLDTSTAFFRDALGWEVIGGDDHYPAVYLSDGQTKLTLWAAWTEDPVAANRETNIGLHHLALAVESKDHLDKIHEVASHWPGVEIEFSPQMNPLGVGPRWHCMMFEPGGNRIEFVFTPK